MNPVEKKFVLLRDLWMRHTDNARARLMVWRPSENADRMLDAFFESQAQKTAWDTPDLFIRLDAAFGTSFGFSRSLREALLEQYDASRDVLNASGIATDWQFDSVPHHDSAAGFLALLASFAEEYRSRFRFIALVLRPHPVTSESAWQAWIEAALHAPVPDYIRLVVVDSLSHARWQALADSYPRVVEIIPAQLDMFDVARDLATESGGGAGAAGPYRQYMTDIMTLFMRGTPAQVAARADKAMQIARREKWLDQEVVLHMMMAGAWLKAADHERAIACYREARTCAASAEEEASPVAASLTMQTWFGEAGTLFASGRWEEAAQIYRRGAEQAMRVPDPMFAVEGFRMAGFCFAHAKKVQLATDHYLMAIREAMPIDAAQRPMTTLPFALQDLMRLHDPRRVEALESSVDDYQAKVTTILAQAEKQSARLGAFPTGAEIARIESALNQHLEENFIDLLKARERLISRGDVLFRDVIAAGRKLLHARWSGLPEVQHPLDKTEAEFPLPTFDEAADVAQTSIEQS